MSVFAGPAFAVFLALGAPAGASAPKVEVRVTQKYLEPLCLDGAPVERGKRSRTTDRVISGEPQWSDATACRP